MPKIRSYIVTTRGPGPLCREREIEVTAYDAADAVTQINVSVSGNFPVEKVVKVTPKKQEEK